MANTASVPTSRHWVASLPGLIAKRLPMMLVSALGAWLTHTFLMAFVNEGTGATSSWVGSLLNTQGGRLLTTPAAMFVWALLSAYVWNFLFLMPSLGPAGAFKRLTDPVLNTFRGVPAFGLQERGAWCVGAGAAVAAAQVVPITPGANIGIACLWANFGLSQPVQWLATRVTSMLPSVMKEAGAGSIAVRAGLAQTLVLAIAPGLIAASILPFGLGWIGAAVLIVLGYMWLAGRNQGTPGAGATALLWGFGLTAALYAALNAIDLLLPLTLLADDGGWAESQCPAFNLVCWINSQGAVDVVISGYAPAIGAAIGPLIPLVGDGGGAPPPGGEPQTPEKEKEWLDRWNAVDPNLLLGNPKLQEEYREIMDRYKATGRIDEKALSDFERKVGQAGDDYRKKWDKETQEAVDRSNQLMDERDAARDRELALAEKNRKELDDKLQDTLKRVAGGDLNSAAGIDIARNPDVYNADGSINKDKLEDFVNRVKSAKRDLAQQQRDDAQALADAENRAGDALSLAEKAARQVRDKSIVVVGGILTGGAGAAAGGGLAGAVASTTVGTYVGAAGGAVKAASDAGKVDRNTLLRGAASGAREGLVGGALGAGVGAAVGGAAAASGTVASAIANNPATTGAVLGAVTAKATGGSVIDGAIEGAIGGKIGAATTNTLGKPGGGWKKPIDWNAPPPPPPSGPPRNPWDDYTSSQPTTKEPGRGPRVLHSEPKEPWMKPIERGGGSAPETAAPPKGPAASDPWGNASTPTGPKGRGSDDGPIVGHDRAPHDWMKPPERGGFEKPGPTKVKGQDIDPPPQGQQPADKRWVPDPNNPRNKIDKGIPEGVDPDGDPYFPDLVTRQKETGPPRDYEGPGARPGEKYPGKVRDDGTFERHTPASEKAAAAAAREREISRLAQQSDSELRRKLTDAEMIAQDKTQADLLRDALKRKAGDTKPPVAPEPPDHTARQAEVDKLKDMSRKELEARELTARLEGDKKQADIYREALNRNKEAVPPPKPANRDEIVKQLSDREAMDLGELGAIRDEARARGKDNIADVYDDAMKKQVKDLGADARAHRDLPPVDELSKKYSLQELKQREQLLRNDGDEAGANRMAEAAKKKMSYGAEEDARLDAAIEARKQAAADAKAAREAEANMTPEQREQKAAALAEQERAQRAAEGQKRQQELNQLMEQMKGAQGKGATPPAPDIDPDAVTNPNLPRLGAKAPPPPPSSDVDLGARTDPNLSRPGTDRPPAPAAEGSDQSAKTDPNLSRPGVKQPAAASPPPQTPSAGDYDGLTTEQLKAMQDMARSSNNQPEVDAIGKALENRGASPHPDRPPDPVMPWEKSGQTPRPDTPETPPAPAAPPPAPLIKPDDLPEPGYHPTSQQRDNLAQNYTQEQLLSARNQARAEGRASDASVLDSVLAEKGYRAPVDPKDVTLPPKGELPDYSQVQSLAKNYSFDQLQELRVKHSKETTLATMIDNAIQEKKMADPMGAADWIARSNQRGG